ncbi:M23 family metallopeptidase [Leptolyngbya sp. FACHB-1515]
MVAADGGRVIQASMQVGGGWGSIIVIDNGNGVHTIYGHPNRINVHVGDLVSQGQTIGGVGAEGDSTGYHLHFQVNVGATDNSINSGHPVDPRPYLTGSQHYATHQFSPGG